MDMRSLEHCLNDITNTAGVQSDLKGELQSFPFSAFNRFRMRIVGERSKNASTSNPAPIIIRQLEDAHEKKIERKAH